MQVRTSGKHGRKSPDIRDARARIASIFQQQILHRQSQY